MNETNLEIAKKVIAENIYIVIATATSDGKPWISPVFFAYDDKYNLFWVSDKNANHSKLIRANPRVAIVIFDSTAPQGDGDGVYFEAKAHELEDDREIERAIEVLGKRVTKEIFRVKNKGEVKGSSAWRIYKAIPLKVSKLTDGEIIDGQYVDKRTDIYGLLR